MATWVLIKFDDKLDLHWMSTVDAPYSACSLIHLVKISFNRYWPWPITITVVMAPIRITIWSSHIYLIYYPDIIFRDSKQKNTPYKVRKLFDNSGLDWTREIWQPDWTGQFLYSTLPNPSFDYYQNLLFSIWNRETEILNRLMLKTAKKGMATVHVS